MSFLAFCIDFIECSDTRHSHHLNLFSDVPIWLEVMNRTHRTKQLLYAVRVKETSLEQTNAESAPDENELPDSEETQNTTTTSRMFVKLRTGVSRTHL